VAKLFPMSPTAVPSVLLGVRRFLDGPHGPPRGSRGLLAVSGGADSTALALALAALAPPRSLALTIGHVDHGLRPTSAAEVRTVRTLGARLDLPVVTSIVAVDPTRAVEATARRLRYRALDRMADEAGATWIATAHTRDDQAETVLLRLVRGAGRGGLGAMRPRRGRLLRPMLEVTRADVRWYLGSLGVTPVEDPSNADLRFLRNRVRHLVLPLLEREMGGAVVERLATIAARLRDEDDLLEVVAAERAAALGVGVGLPVSVAREPPAIARRIVRRWLDRDATRASTGRHVEAVLEIATGPGGRSVSMPGRGRVRRAGPMLVWEPATDDAEEPFAHAVGPGVSVDGPPAAPWCLVFSALRDRREVTSLPAGADHALFDADRLPGTLAVRSVRRGDRMAVPGVGTRKLQDLLVDRHIPRGRRGAVPVVTAGDEIVWVPGIARSAAAPITPETTHVLEAELQNGEVFGLPTKNHCDSLERHAGDARAGRR
jgi:tRNA(Ile)-lysidine synthase